VAIVKKGFRVLLVEDGRPLTLTEVVFMALSGIRGGSIATCRGSQYALEKGSIDLMAGSGQR